MVISFTITHEELDEFKEIILRGLPMKETKHSVFEAYLRKWAERSNHDGLGS
jgi:hypothetical protein